ncbi:ABC transporter ATP-binding protein [Subtercola sp. YIM 133946]|uniref:ABC transporter ATP-binding protein n=1 Tax=Subtercola sp. YIM 133946 TaxID=3118909 RepID=UPI002F95038C
MIENSSVHRDSRPLLEVRDLGVVYKLGRRRPPLQAVDGVSLSVAPRETVGIVGESGSGKSTIGRAILGLAPIDRGTISLAGDDITHAGYGQRRKISADLQVIFQDPYSSLNPTRTIGQTLSESLIAQGHRSRSEIEARVATMLHRVGMSEDAASKYPNRFSGGQRQRIAIARALMTQPRLVICDEPTSALDLSVQAQILNLMRELQDEFQLSYLFIAHDLAVVRHLSHRIIVVYKGQVMEQGASNTVYSFPAHPYTRALLSAVPVPDPVEQGSWRELRLSDASEARAPSGENACPFASRCPHAVAICRTSRPALEETPEGSSVACHRWRDLRTPATTAVRNNGISQVPQSSPSNSIGA